MKAIIASALVLALSPAALAQNAKFITQQETMIKNMDRSLAELKKQKAGKIYHVIPLGSGLDENIAALEAAIGETEGTVKRLKPR